MNSRKTAAERLSDTVARYEEALTPYRDRASSDISDALREEALPEGVEGEQVDIENSIAFTSMATLLEDLMYAAQAGGVDFFEALQFANIRFARTYKAIARDLMFGVPYDERG